RRGRARPAPRCRATANPRDLRAGRAATFLRSGRARTTSGSASARPHAAVPRSRADVAAPLSCPGSPARLRVREPPLQEETRAMGKSRKPATDAARFRVEHDSMGELRVPADALWGAQTQRAV